MYIRAYQSYVMNPSVSRRIHGFGCDTLVGDLVLEKKELHTKKDPTDIVNADRTSRLGNVERGLPRPSRSELPGLVCIERIAP
ncbi:hypothetical protein BS47DRAFT_1347170 [Hydnum rufescens UP504]|uniref:Uncharacterized protein n=1 Tax=Hydnum rufescens UP504 TaxID=1448309 RepID=A0A9P6DRE1_9AGAM|nr:hypothetical protein BS47DRAFT_1354216 [Hydnum rufescens UP504]KAF9511012.1 hypothetical protein BS47DRAFT_1347170 [Hydnum rufescens UP504]